MTRSVFHQANTIADQITEVRELHATICQLIEQEFYGETEEYKSSPAVQMARTVTAHTIQFEMLNS